MRLSAARQVIENLIGSHGRTIEEASAERIRPAPSKAHALLALVDDDAARLDDYLHFEQLEDQSQRVAVDDHEIR